MENLKNDGSVGVVKISDEVVSVIAGIAAEEIPGVAEFHQGVSNNISQMLKGKKSQGKAVKVELQEERATISLAISVEYGVKIMDVVVQVQENVKKTVEAMTGLVVSSVDVYVQNIFLPKNVESESKAK